MVVVFAVLIILYSVGIVVVYGTRVLLRPVDEAVSLKVAYLDVLIALLWLAIIDWSWVDEPDWNWNSEQD